MKTLIVGLFFISSATAGVFCQYEDGSSNGAWQVAMSWDGTSRRTCNGATRPVYYRIVADAAWGAQSHADRQTELQQVFTDVWRGDSIEFAAGQTFQWGHPDVPIRITSRPGTGYVTVTTTEYAKLPNSGTRITPAYKPVMATLEMAMRTSLFALSGNGPSPATHFIFRGLYFQPTTETASYTYKLVDGTDTPVPVIKLGGSANNWYNATTGIPNADNDFPNTSVRAPVLGGNVSGHNVIEVANSTRLTSGTRILVGSYNSSAAYTVDQVNSATVGRHYITTTTPLTAPVTSGQAIFVPLEKPEYQPDQITIQHCVFVNPKHRVELAKMIVVNSRHTVIRDNFFSGVVSVMALRDTQILSGIESPGPHYIENNYIDGGSENIMYGGSTFSGIGGDPENSSGMLSVDIKYNFLSHIPERDYFGPWSLTQEAGIPGQTRTYAGVSVPGLPPNSPRLVFVGRIVGQSTKTSLTSKALNTGVVGTIEPEWAATAVGLETYDYDPARSDYGQTWCNGQWNPGDGVCWKSLNRVGSTTFPRPLIKNNFELKHGRNVTVQHNVFDWFGSMKPYNGNQYAMINIKTEGGPDSSRTNCRNGMPFPYCWRGETENIYLLNNVLRGHSGGIVVTGNQTLVGTGEHGGTKNIVVRGNLLVQTERPWDAQWSIYRPIFIGMNKDDFNVSTPIPNIVVEKNTFYTPYVLPRGTFALGHLSSSHSSGGVVSGNIWSRGSTGSMAWATGYGGDNADDGGVIINDYFPGIARGGEWGKNIILGASITGFPSGTVWSGCPTPLPCITSTAATPKWNEVFVDPEGGNFTLRDDHWGKRALPDGSDLGADPNQLAEIRHLIVTPTDRRVYFQWNVTRPIAHIPCVVEVHTAPDLESTTWQGRPAGYAGELSDISKYAGGESDSSYWNVRSDTERTLTIGRAHPLEPGTTYYYRLHCGGDVRRGSFKTLDPVDGTADQTISRFIEDANTRSMRVEYGLSYDRNRETITDGATATAACRTQDTCSVSFPAGRGTVVYYRWAELDESGAVIRASNVSTLVVQ